MDVDLENGTDLEVSSTFIEVANKVKASVSNWGAKKYVLLQIQWANNDYFKSLQSKSTRQTVPRKG